MAKRGRPPKPLAEKLLTENPGNRPLNMDAPQPVSPALPPKDLTKEAAAIWNRAVLGQQEGLYTICDEELLAQYCEAAAMRRLLQADMKNQPRLIDGSTGKSQIINPLISAIERQARLCISLGAELGMSPRARQSLELKTSNTAKKSKFGGLVGGTNSESTTVQ